MALWSFDECIALSLGKNPYAVSAQKLQPYNLIGSPVVKQFYKNLDLADRAKKAGQLFDSMLPGLFIAWAKRHIGFPTDLEAAVIAHGGQVADWRSLFERAKSELAATHEQLVSSKRSELELLQKLNALTDELASTRSGMVEATEKPVGVRERESLLKIIIGMAVIGYGFDPRALKSKTASEIASDLEIAGVGLDVDTVRKWLTEAKQLLPDKV